MIQHGTVGDWRLADDDAFLASFRLPTAEEKNDKLKAQNPIPRDDRISFIEATHTYLVDGLVFEKSVTQVIHQFTHDFDAPSAIQAMKQRDWETKQQLFLRDDGEVMSDAEIAAMWRKNGEVSRARGTLMHYQIEQWLNGCELEAPRSPEIEQFLVLQEAAQIQPFRTELSIFHSVLKIAGQIDCLAKDEHGDITIWDWKRAKEIRMDGFRQMRYPLHHLADSNFWHYALQLNLYLYILETEYELKVSHMRLGVLHPLIPGPICVDIPRMDAEIALIVAHKLASV